MRIWLQPNQLQNGLRTLTGHKKAGKSSNICVRKAACKPESVTPVEQLKWAKKKKLQEAAVKAKTFDPNHKI